MAAPRSRKPPRRPPPRITPLDPELHELAVVLNEFRLECNAKGWFTLPWRNGRNAVSLATAYARTFVAFRSGRLDPSLPTAMSDGFTTLALRFGAHLQASGLYWTIDDIRDDLRTVNHPGVPALRAALRCLQLWLSSSDGGGHGYNIVLQDTLVDVSEELVLEWRCHDAIGVGSQLDGSPADKQRRAFRLAWERGLFHAAYALPPARF